MRRKDSIVGTISILDLGHSYSPFFSLSSGTKTWLPLTSLRWVPPIHHIYISNNWEIAMNFQHGFPLTLCSPKQNFDPLLINSSSVIIRKNGYFYKYHHIPNFFIKLNPIFLWLHQQHNHPQTICFQTKIYVAMTLNFSFTSSNWIFLNCFLIGILSNTWHENFLYAYEREILTHTSTML